MQHGLIHAPQPNGPVPANSHKDETCEKKDYQRIVTTGSIGISRRRREDWLSLRAAKQMGEKSKETKVTAAKSRRYHRKRGVSDLREF